LERAGGERAMKEIPRMKMRVMFLLQWILVAALVALAGCGTVDKNDPTYNTKQILIRDTRPSN
jgi:hypothetical protein